MNQDSWVAVIVVLLVMILGFGLFVDSGDEPAAVPPTPVSSENSGQPMAGTCRPTGCSGQFCADQEVVSTCEWQPQYACYRTATCERQPNTGQCGWTPTTALTACLANPPVGS